MSLALRLVRLLLRLRVIRSPSHLTQLLRRIAVRRHFRKLLILDLDATLIWAEEEPNRLDQDAILMAKGKPYWVKKRPHLDEFLDYCFAEYDVGVWSAAPKAYVHAIAAYLARGRQWVFVMSGERCTQHFVLELQDTVVLKKLEKVWKAKETRGLYNKCNTLILDDSAETFQMNRGNAIRIRPYIGRTENDRELPRVAALLRRLRFVGDVRMVKDKS